MKALLHLWMLFLIVLFFTTGRTDRRYQQRRFSDYNEETAARAERPDQKRRFSNYNEEEKETHQEEQADSRATLTEGDKPQCLQRNYEPLLSFGDFFLARMTATSERSLLGAYTKNRTILVCTIAAFCFGVLLGFSFTVPFRKCRAPTVHRSTLTSDLLSTAGENTASTEDRSSDTQETTRAGIDALHLDDTQQNVEETEDDKDDEEDGTEADSDCTFWQTSTMEEADGQSSAQSDEKCETPHSKLRKAKSDITVSSSQQDRSAKIVNRKAVHRTDTDRLCGQLQELTETLRKTHEPLSAVIAATEGISADVGTLKNVTHWMAWRKAKKDMWLQATDNMSYGMLVMNVTLAVCAARFGRWQDWGLQCDTRFFSWSIHSFLGMLWCWVEEQFIFLLGCSVWWLTMRYAFSSTFLKRKQPSSTIVLSLTLICTGILHSFTVALLGGSSTISFSVWLLYSMFLVQALESAKESIPGGGVQPSLHPAFKPFFYNASLNAFMAIVVFPVLAGSAPFWSVGLYLSFMSIFERCMRTVKYQTYQIADDFLEFLVH